MNVVNVKQNRLTSGIDTKRKLDGGRWYNWADQSNLADDLLGLGMTGQRLMSLIPHSVDS